jgi:outer membrane protein OmpA-like peptidoglycan-associated protein
VSTTTPAKTVQCVANTDDHGSAAADRALTVKQAAAACAYLRTRGITAKLTSTGNGHDKPRSKVPAANRRLTITITY